MARALSVSLAFCLASVFCSAASAQVRSPWDLTRRDEDLRVSLVTFGPGDSVHQYFGHNALLVEDTAQDIGALYNFGMFSFGPDMLPKYLRGQLEFWVAATPVQATYRHYVEENRSIRVRELNLSPARRRVLASALGTAALPENRSYLYEHYTNNCSTKLRDYLDKALDGQFSKLHAGTARLTHRGHTRRYTEHDPVIHMLLLLWMNDSMEHPIRAYDEAFLPDELDRLVEQTTYVDEQGKRVPLAGTAYTVFEAKRDPVPETPSRAWPGLLAVGLLIGGSAFALARWLRSTRRRLPRVLLGLHHMLVGFCFGLPGLIAFLLLFTNWQVTHFNENLWLANPLTFLAFPLGFWSALGSQRALRLAGAAWLALGASTALLFVLKLLPAFDQDTSLPMALFAPINLGCAFAHWALRERSAVAAKNAAGADVPPAEPATRA